MAKTKIITTGLNGLIGSKFKQLYRDQYQFINLGLDETEPTDITDLAAVESIIQKHPDATAIIHLAAYTDVNGAFAQTGDKNGLTYQVNVIGTQNMIEMAKSYGKQLIHISTAYVFPGDQTDPYLETDQPKAIEWYGQTKLWAEEAVLAAIEQGLSAAILRIDQPFRSDNFARPDVLHKLITGLQSGNLYPQFTNHYFGPTFIDDFAKILNWALINRPTGIWHATSGEQWTDYDLAREVAVTLGLDEKTVQAGDLDDYLAQAARPYQRNTALNTDKLRAALDFELTPIKAAVAQTVRDYLAN